MLKVLFAPRQRLIGVALLLAVVLSACGAPLAGESWANLSTDGKYIYVAYKENIFKIDPMAGGEQTTRQMIWLGQSPNKGHMYAAPAIAEDGTLYVGTYDKKFLAFTTNSTAPIWENDKFTEKVVGGALVSGDSVYVGLGDKGMKAFDRKTGAEKWTFKGTKYGVWSSPLLINGSLIFGSMDHNIYVLNPETGELKTSLDIGGAVGGTPLYDNGVLYVGTFNNTLVSVALDGPAMKVTNTFATEGWVWGTPVLQDGILYFGDLKGFVYALSLKDWSKPIWKVSDTEHPGAVRGAVALATIKNGDSTQKIVIVGSESKFVRAYDQAKGDVVWTAGISAEDKILSDLIVMGDYVIFTTLSENQIVRAYSISTGRPAWSVKLSDEVARLQTTPTTAAK